MSARPAAQLCLSAAAVTGVVMLKHSWCMAMPTRLILSMSHTWSARTGPLVLDVKRLPQANPVGSGGR